MPEVRQTVRKKSAAPKLLVAKRKKAAPEDELLARVAEMRSAEPHLPVEDLFHKFGYELGHPVRPKR